MKSKVLNHLVNLRSNRLENKNPNADKIEFLANDDLLKKLGLLGNVSKINDKITKEDMYLSEALLYNQEKVFKLSDIKKTSEDYGIKFLDAKLYKSLFDISTSSHIELFEAEHHARVYQGALFVLAPKESFESNDSNAESFLFYKINDKYYYLIHSWGESPVSIFKIKYPFLTALLASFIISAIVLTSFYFSQSKLLGILSFVSVLSTIIFLKILNLKISFRITKETV